ncbi:MAG: haloacid dehalogenase-like hydrolase [Lactobacillales bacterium]|jgi:hypothetical protein|nr:haloacid dehalogenase-like hydrolase [Lactobacillales bacterium]
MKNEKKPITAAICYDFDGTLSPGNMQEHSFIKELNIPPAVFWGWVNDSCAKNKADPILTYMYLMKREKEKTGQKLTKESLKNAGKDIPFFPGVPEWFNRINAYASARGIVLEHYIISSGLKEIASGCAIAPFLKEIFASSYAYDDSGAAVWVANAINYTNKTQFLYRINKGCFDLGDHVTINKHMPADEKYVPFRHMIYIGDGETDVPSMRVIRSEGGYAIAVYSGGKEKVMPLLSDNRVDMVAPADYCADGVLDSFIKVILDKIQIDAKLKDLT